MQNHTSFDNPFLSNPSQLQSSRTSPFFPPLKHSQHLQTNNHFRQQSSQYPFHLFHRFFNHSLYSEQNPLTRHNPQQSSFMYKSQIPGKDSLILERSKSQVIQPVYLSSFKNRLSDNLGNSMQLGTSKASQITFSKPSQFIINTPKYNVYLESSNKSFISIPQIVTDDYGYTFDNFHSLKPKVNESFISVTSPMKQSYCFQPFHSCRNSVVLNHISPHKPQILEDIKNPMPQSNRFNHTGVPGTQIQKNPSSAKFTIRPSLGRCLSNISVFSQKGQIKLSHTKISFNYISPSKRQNKIEPKISFKNQNIKNPLSKLSKKKQQKLKKTQDPRSQINREPVNEYFPEFKIKKNKIKIGLLSQAKQTAITHDVKNDNQTKQSVNHCERRNTFIASLDAFSQLSDIKSVEKAKAKGTPTQTQHTKIMSHSVSEYFKNSNKTKIQSKSPESCSIAGYRITLDGKKVPLSSPLKQKLNSIKESQVSNNSQLSVNSMKNAEDVNFMKKHGNDSSHTTDYEEEIVKKIKEDLGLHFSYANKK